jgi:hypothetical protein
VGDRIFWQALLLSLVLVLLALWLLLWLIPARAQGLGQTYLPLVTNGEPAISATAWIMPTANPVATPQW